MLYHHDANKLARTICYFLLFYEIVELNMKSVLEFLKICGARNRVGIGIVLARRAT
jgi:hypothetical protein